MSGQQNKGSAGFTLLEVVVAFTVVALMAGMVFSSLRMAVNAYERSQNRIEEEANRRALFDQIKRQLGSLFPVAPTAGFQLAPEAYQQAPDPISQIGMGQLPLFLGESDFVTFVTIAPLVIHENPGLTVVRYGLAQNEFGEFYLGAMETRYTGQPSFEAMLNAPRGKPLTLVPKVEHVEFHYYGFEAASNSYRWFPSWNGAEAGSVPTAIRINFNNDYMVVPINASFMGANLFQGIRKAAMGVVGE